MFMAGNKNSNSKHNTSLHPLSVELQPTNCLLVYDLPSSRRFVQRSMSHAVSRQRTENMGEFKNAPITV